MKSFDSKAHWQNVYGQQKATEVSWYQARPTLSLELIDNCGLDRSAPIIDVGGGASVLVDHLLRQGHTHLAVLDVSGLALAASRKRLGEMADSVKWIECDVTEFAPEGRFAIWHDRAVFHFLTEPEDRRRYVRTLENTLEIGGYLILACFAIGGPEKCSGLPIVQYDAQKLSAELGPGFRLIEERSEEHVTPSGRMQAFAYFRFERCDAH